MVELSERHFRADLFTHCYKRDSDHGERLEGIVSDRLLGSRILVVLVILVILVELTRLVHSTPMSLGLFGLAVRRSNITYDVAKNVSERPAQQNDPEDEHLKDEEYAEALAQGRLKKAAGLQVYAFVDINNFKVKLG